MAIPEPSMTLEPAAGGLSMIRCRVALLVLLAVPRRMFLHPSGPPVVLVSPLIESTTII
jgi:hypothetical protein